MKFVKYDEDFMIENILSHHFGKSTATEGTGDLWRTVWVVGNYMVDLNGGEQVSQYYLYLKYKQ